MKNYIFPNKNEKMTTKEKIKKIMISDFDKNANFLDKSRYKIANNKFPYLFNLAIHQQGDHQTNTLSSRISLLTNSKTLS